MSKPLKNKASPKNALQAQLLKAGLVDEKKLKKTNGQQDHAKRTGEATLNDELAQEIEARKQAEQARQAAIEADKKQQRDAQDHAQRLGQILKRHGIRKQDGDQPFQFIDEGKIKKLYFSQQMYNQIVNGQLLIAVFQGQHYFLPYPLYERVHTLWPDAIIVNNRKASDAQENAPATEVEDDPYAAYVIPDDLMW